jgi:hypothetical protein
VHRKAKLAALDELSVSPRKQTINSVATRFREALQHEKGQPMTRETIDQGRSRDATRWERSFED